MPERSAAFDDIRNDPRLRCILCESLLPTPVPTAVSERLPDPICLPCWALAPEARRLLGDQAMARLVRPDLTR